MGGYMLPLGREVVPGSVKVGIQGVWGIGFLLVNLIYLRFWLCLGKCYFTLGQLFLAVQWRVCTVAS